MTISIYCDPMPEDGFGFIYFQTPQGCFPSDNWDDFGGAIAFEWLRTTLEWRKQHEDGACRFFFMEGPFDFYAARANADEFILHFYERGIDGLIALPKFRPVTVSRREFFESLLSLVSVITWHDNSDKVARMADELRAAIDER